MKASSRIPRSWSPPLTLCLSADLPDELGYKIAKVFYETPALKEFYKKESDAGLGESFDLKTTYMGGQHSLPSWRREVLEGKGNADEVAQRALPGEGISKRGGEPRVEVRRGTPDLDFDFAPPEGKRSHAVRKIRFADRRGR